MDKLLESVALEVESCSRDFRAGLARIDGIEKAAVVCAFVMLGACFLPWFSTEHTYTHIGLDGLATPHFAIAMTLILLVRRVANERRLNKNISSVPPEESHVLEDNRIALFFLLLGALSTATCIALLIHFGDIATFLQGPINVRYGFYIVLISGMGISACGIAKFS